MGARLSLRPDLDQDVGLLALYVSGNLPNAKPEAAYEGRLKIHNAEGACTAEQIGGDTLPPGSSVFVDNATQQVVVAWPAYAEFVTPLQNPNFESGDLSGWTLTPKGGTATATADTSQKFDGAYSLRWPGGKGLGSEGGIEVEAWNNTIGPCLPGQRVTSHARCMYNPGGHNFGSRYQGLLRFLDGAGMPIGPAVRGRQFKGRGENGRWNDASATGVGPVGTKGVQMGAWLTGSNAPVWLDSASWDVPSSVGINIETTLNLTLRVRDSAGRTALWAGSILVTDWGALDSGPAILMDDISAVILDGIRVTEWESRTPIAFNGGFVNLQSMPTIPEDGPNGLRTLRFINQGGGGFFKIPGSAADAVDFARNVNSAWAFAVFKRNTADGTGILIDQRCPWSVVVESKYGTPRFSLQTDATGGVAVRSLRDDDSTAMAVVTVPGAAPVGNWIAVLACCDYVARTTKIWVNGDLMANQSGLWNASGPTSDTASPSTNVGGTYLSPSGGPSGGARSGFLNNVDVACVLAGSGSGPISDSDRVNMFAYYMSRYGL